MQQIDHAAASAAIDSASTVVARETAHLRIALEMAQTARRDRAAIKAELLSACSEESFARSAFYTIQTDSGNEPRPSVQLAREVARSWGHVRTGFAILANAAEFLQLRGWAWDLTTGAHFEVEEVVAKMVHRRDPKTGRGYMANLTHDDKAWRAAVKCAGAIAMRGALLEVLPRTLVDDALARCVQTEKQEVERNRERTIESMVAAFAGIGVERDLLALWLGRSVSHASTEEILHLRGIFTAIKDGDVSAETVFKPAAAPDAPRKVAPEPSPKPLGEDVPEPQPVVETTAAELVSEPGEGDDAEFLEGPRNARKPVNAGDAALAALLAPAAAKR